MAAPQVTLPLQAKMAITTTGLVLQGITEIKPIQLNLSQMDKPLRQKGGKDEAIKVLHTFLNGRASRYRGGI